MRAISEARRQARSLSSLCDYLPASSYPRFTPCIQPNPPGQNFGISQLSPPGEANGLALPASNHRLRQEKETTQYGMIPIPPAPTTPSQPPALQCAPERPQKIPRKEEFDKFPTMSRENSCATNIGNPNTRLLRSATIEAGKQSKPTGKQEGKPARMMIEVWNNPSPCLLYTSPSPRDKRQSRMPSSA